MALIVKDRVQETTSTVGTIALVLTGTVSGFQSFSSIGNGNTTYYCVVGGTEWEVGIGTYTLTGTVLSRDTILASSNGGSAVNFSVGVKNVFVTYPAGKSVTIDDVQTLTNKSINLASNTLTGTTAQFNTALSDGDFATLAGTETLTNKSLNGTLGTTTPSTIAATTISASGVSTFSAGSAAAPAITTAGDTNTGIFFPAADTIAFAEGGAEAMRIDASGNLGIGNTTPSSFNASADNLVVGTTSGDNGITVVSGSASQGSVFFADGTTGGAQQAAGYIAYVHTTDYMALGTANTERMRLDSSSNLQFNSGYGSVATAYGCRAWVNFNGTGTVAIRASGNVSSITDNGVGNYTINFTTAFPDANYASLVNTQGSSTGSIVGEWGSYTSATNAFQAPTTSNFRITTWNSAVSGLADTAYVMASVYR